MVSGPMPDDKHIWDFRTHGSLEEQWEDQVVRKNKFVQKHPEVAVTTPRQNGTDEHRAQWEDSEHTAHQLAHTELRYLLDALDAAFNRPREIGNREEP